MVAARGARASDRPKLAALHEVERADKRLPRASLLKEELRLLYHLDDACLEPAHLEA